jgi:hypothetical protein
MEHRKPAARASGREKMIGPLALLLFAVTLAGCQWGKHSYYISPRVTGRVLAADTQQPLDRATVRRVLPQPYGGADTPPKASQLQMIPGGVRTDEGGRFVLDAERVVAVFRRGSWHSVTVSCERAGYTGFQTNYTATRFKERSPEGVPLVNAGDILLPPKPK